MKHGDSRVSARQKPTESQNKLVAESFSCHTLPEAVAGLLNGTESTKLFFHSASSSSISSSLLSISNNLTLMYLLLFNSPFKAAVVVLAGVRHGDYFVALSPSLD